MKQFAQRFVSMLDSKPPRGARGQSLVELALTAPLLFLMVIGTAEIGFLANNYLIALDAVREGGRYAVVGNPLAWQTNPNAADGDPETRKQNRADCETTISDPGATLFHINRADRDTARGFPSPSAHPALNGYSAGGETATLGFYDGAACQVVAALDPLFFDYTTDDIVISVVAYANRCAQWDPLNQAACFADWDGNRQIPVGTHTLEVTGRWPLSNRKCPSDVRDPFNIGGALVPVAGQTNNDIRGYIMTGNQTTPGCVGSRFYVGNAGDTTEFNLTYRMNSLPDSLVQKSVPGGAMVIVELYWTHHLLFDFPPFSFFKGPTGGVAFSVYMMFPVTAAEPTLTPDS
jgi:hypothetical protein